MQPHFKRRLLKYTTYLRSLIFLGVIILGSVALINYLLPLFRFARQNNITPGFVLNLFFGKEMQMKKYQGRTNVVILGVAGGQHEGADLTDTNIFLSIDFSKPDIVMISLPRDIWLPSIRDKINSAYHYGEAKMIGGGLLTAKAAIEEVIGQPVHYALVLDFSGFVKIIDLIGGIDVFVEKAFTDNYYPIAGKENDFCDGDPTFACRYQQLKFEAGWQIMNGDRALKYVRSRMAEGEEGSDFAREKRQQQVIVAFKNKLIGSSIIRNPTKAKQLFSAINEAVLTDLNWSEKLLMSKFFLTFGEGKMRRIVLDSGDEEKGKKGFLVHPPEWQYNGAWVLAPRTGNFEEIQKYILCQLEEPNCPMQP